MEPWLYSMSSSSDALRLQIWVRKNFSYKIENTLLRRFPIVRIYLHIYFIINKFNILMSTAILYLSNVDSIIIGFLFRGNKYILGDWTLLILYQINYKIRKIFVITIFIFDETNKSFSFSIVKPNLLQKHFVSNDRLLIMKARYRQHHLIINYLCKISFSTCQNLLLLSICGNYFWKKDMFCALIFP